MRNKVTLTLILFSLSIFGQDNPQLNRAMVKMWAIDSKNNSDTVQFGYDRSATDGLDANLGEIDISNQGFNKVLELRCFQRKPENQICGQGGYAFYSDVDFDSKINYRKSLCAGNFFEFFIKGTNYPIQLYADFDELFDSTFYSGWTRAFLVDSLCYTPKIKSPYHAGKLLFTIDNNKQYIVKISLDHTFHGGIFEINKACEFNIFPTIVTDYLTIENVSENQINFIYIFNSLGQKVINQKFTANLKLDLTSLEKGIYFVQLKSAIRVSTETFKISKK